MINDLCKHGSWRRGLPYVIVATAPSMDGYASSGAALLLDGMKVTVPAGPRPPFSRTRRCFGKRPSTCCGPALETRWASSPP